jgi:hypothetical protein
VVKRFHLNRGQNDPSSINIEMELATISDSLTSQLDKKLLDIQICISNHSLMLDRLIEAKGENLGGLEYVEASCHAKALIIRATISYRLIALHPP